MGRFIPVIVFIVLVVILILVAMIISYYKKCPPGHVLVIFNTKPDSFGNMLKIIFSGGAFVFPVFCSYQLFSLAPYTLELKITDLKTKDQKNLFVQAQCIVGITKHESVLQQAVDRISGMTRDEIEKVAFRIVSGRVRLLIATLTAIEAEIPADFTQKLSTKIEEGLAEIGMKLISFEIEKSEIRSSIQV